ncbi:MAG: cupin domain-containing protein [Cyanobacteria bacterium P01_A01_bin.114]
MTDPTRPQPSEDGQDDIEALAALYALSALDDEGALDKAGAIKEEGSLEEAANITATTAGFAQQVSEYEATLASIPYSLPSIPMAADLKSRLFQRIADGSAVPTPDSHSSELMELLERSIEALKQQSANLTWAAMPGGSNAEIAIWQTDLRRREAAFFVRSTVGGVFPNHAHASGETVLVLDGDFVVDGQVYSVGDRISSMASTAHQPETHQGCLLLCISSIDDEILG